MLRTVLFKVEGNIQGSCSRNTGQVNSRLIVILGELTRQKQGAVHLNCHGPHRLVGTFAGIKTCIQ